MRTLQLLARTRIHDAMRFDEHWDREFFFTIFLHFSPVLCSSAKNGNGVTGGKKNKYVQFEMITPNACQRRKQMSTNRHATTTTTNADAFVCVFFFVVTKYFFVSALTVFYCANALQQQKKMKRIFLFSRCEQCENILSCSDVHSASSRRLKVIVWL